MDQLPSIDSFRSLDLTSVIASVMEREGWTEDRARRTAEEYKQFLFSATQCPTSPTKEVDVLWHNHILDTQKYHRDCNALFGFYLHHEPLPPGINPLPRSAHCNPVSWGHCCSSCGGHKQPTKDQRRRDEIERLRQRIKSGEEEIKRRKKEIEHPGEHTYIPWKKGVIKTRRDDIKRWKKEIERLKNERRKERKSVPKRRLKKSSTHRGH